MKFKIQQNDLLKTLLAVNRSILAKTNLPILSGVLISTSGEVLEVLSTNLETAARVGAVCKTETTGKAVLPGRVLFGVVSRISQREVFFEKRGEEFLEKLGSYGARFETMQTEDFPETPSPSGSCDTNSKSILPGR